MTKHRLTLLVLGALPLHTSPLLIGDADRMALDPSLIHLLPTLDGVKASSAPSALAMLPASEHPRFLGLRLRDLNDLASVILASTPFTISHREPLHTKKPSTLGR